MRSSLLLLLLLLLTAAPITLPNIAEFMQCCSK